MTKEVSAAEAFEHYQREAETIALRDAHAAGVIVAVLGIAKTLNTKVIELAKKLPPEEGAPRE